MAPEKKSEIEGLIKEMADIKRMLILVIARLGPGNTAKTTPKVDSGHIRPKEFMKAVDIKPTKYFELVKAKKVNRVKKDRKVYIPVSEIARYFADSGFR